MKYLILTCMLLMTMCCLGAVEEDDYVCEYLSDKVIFKGYVDDLFVYVENLDLNEYIQNETPFFVEITGIIQQIDYHINYYHAPCVTLKGIYPHNLIKFELFYSDDYIYENLKFKEGDEITLTGVWYETMSRIPVIVNHRFGSTFSFIVLE